MRKTTKNKAKYYLRERAFVILSLILLLNLCLIISIGFKSDDVVFTRKKGGVVITHRDLKLSIREVKKEEKVIIEVKEEKAETEIVKIPTKTDRVKIEGDKKPTGFKNTKEFIEAFKRASYQEKINLATQGDYLNEWRERIRKADEKQDIDLLEVY